MFSMWLKSLYMSAFRIRMPIRPRSTVGSPINMQSFQNNLNMATLHGKVDAATATEHVFRVNQLIQQNKHKEATRFVNDLNRSLGFDNEAKFK